MSINDAHPVIAGHLPAVTAVARRGAALSRSPTICQATNNLDC
jgi:hypothetical protein